MKSLFNAVSFNGRYVSASLVYLGMTFVLLCAAPEIALYVRADSGQEHSCSHTVTRYYEGNPVTETVPGCAEGYTCCELTGECVEIE